MDHSTFEDPTNCGLYTGWKAEMGEPTLSWDSVRGVRPGCRDTAVCVEHSVTQGRDRESPGAGPVAPVCEAVGVLEAVGGEVQAAEALLQRAGGRGGAGGLRTPCLCSLPGGGVRSTL